MSETTLIRVYNTDNERLKKRGFYGESIADILARELVMAEYWKVAEHNKDMNKAIQDKLSATPQAKKGAKIKTPRNDTNKMIQWKMEGA